MIVSTGNKEYRIRNSQEKEVSQFELESGERLIQIHKGTGPIK